MKLILNILSWFNPASWLGGAAGKVVEGLAGVVANAIVQRGNTEAGRQADQNASGVGLATQYLTSVNETNKIKAAYRPIWFVLFGLTAFAAPVGLHWWAVMLDSMPFYIPFAMDDAHRVGSWKIAGNWNDAWKETYHKIIDSFFISAPATAALAVLVKLFHR